MLRAPFLSTVSLARQLPRLIRSSSPAFGTLGSAVSAAGIGGAGATGAAAPRTLIRAAVARGPKQAFTINDLYLDEPQAGEVLVRVIACGICHTDLVRGCPVMKRLGFSVVRVSLFQQLTRRNSRAVGRECSSMVSCTLYSIFPCPPRPFCTYPLGDSLHRHFLHCLLCPHARARAGRSRPAHPITRTDSARPRRCGALIPASLPPR